MLDLSAYSLDELRHVYTDTARLLNAVLAEVARRQAEEPVFLPQAQADEYAAIKAEDEAAAHVPLHPVTEAGMYRQDGVIYKVQKAVHGSGHLYAKRLVLSGYATDDNGGPTVGTTAHFEYAAGMIRKLYAEDRMTLEQAKEFGALYGTCCVCGRTLTNETSIEAGIGPVCGNRI